VSPDNSLLYVSNFGSDSVAVYSIDNGRSLGTIPVGRGPDALALSPNQNFLLVVDAKSGDVTVVRTAKLPQGSKLSADYGLFTMVPVGLQPNQIAVKAFVANPVK
jgi:YVTN family beta-propeller protein